MHVKQFSLRFRPASLDRVSGHTNTTATKLFEASVFQSYCRLYTSVGCLEGVTVSQPALLLQHHPKRSRHTVLKEGGGFSPATGSSTVRLCFEDKAQLWYVWLQTVFMMSCNENVSGSQTALLPSPSAAFTEQQAP